MAAGSMVAVCIFLGALKGSQIRLKQEGSNVHVSTTLVGVSNGEHGFHIHDKGDLGNECKNAGPHYNPENKNHGYPDSAEHHKGDLGNFLVSGSPTVHNATYTFFTVEEVLGRAFVVHAARDDGGQGGNEESLKTGNAGARLDCCVIVANKPNVTTSKPSSAVATTQRGWIVIVTAALVGIVSLFIWA